MLIDDFITEYDFHERHETFVSAPKEVVRRAVEEWKPSESFFWRLLLRLRGLGSPQGTLREWAQANGFLCLAQTDAEVVYGQAGRFWAVDETGALVSPDTTEEFRRLNDPRYAIAVMTVRVQPIAPTRTRLYTETRVRALSAGARRRFRLYWLLVRPFSGLLRRAMLRGIKAHATKTSTASTSRKEIAT